FWRVLPKAICDDKLFEFLHDVFSFYIWNGYIYLIIFSIVGKKRVFLFGIVCFYCQWRDADGTSHCVKKSIVACQNVTVGKKSGEKTEKIICFCSLLKSWHAVC
ncbi:MAG: hypothetical protein IKP58_07680, partial [Victivallales bacterium]|nr:hypothetical protein [Victivallales bacterium]